MAQHLRIIHIEAGNATVGRGEQNGDVDGDDLGSDTSLLLLNDKGIRTEGIFCNLDWPHGGVPVVAEIMMRQTRVMQDEAGTVTFQDKKRHLNVDNNYDTGPKKSPPPVNDRAIDAGGIFLNLDPQRGCGPQRPLRSPCLEADFLDEGAPFFHTYPDGSDQEQQDKDRMAQNSCEK